MSASTTLISSLKTYARIDYDDTALTMLANAAIEKCEQETGKAFVETSNLYMLAVEMLALHWYENRGGTSTQAQTEIPFSLQPILNQIALSADYAEVTTA